MLGCQLDETVIWNEQFPPRAAFAQSISSQKQDGVGHRARPKVTLTTLTGRTERTEGHSPDRRQQAHFVFILAFKP